LAFKNSEKPKKKGSKKTEKKGRTAHSIGIDEEGLKGSFGRTAERKGGSTLTNKKNWGGRKTKTKCSKGGVLKICGGKWV